MSATQVGQGQRRARAVDKFSAADRSYSDLDAVVLGCASTGWPMMNLDSDTLRPLNLSVVLKKTHSDWRPSEGAQPTMLLLPSIRWLSMWPEEEPVRGSG